MLQRTIKATTVHDLKRIGKQWGKLDLNILATPLDQIDCQETIAKALLVYIIMLKRLDTSFHIYQVILSVISLNNDCEILVQKKSLIGSNQIALMPPPPPHIHTFSLGLYLVQHGSICRLLPTTQMFNLTLQAFLSTITLDYGKS